MDYPKKQNWILNISARHFELTPALKSFVEDKILKIEHYNKDILNCHVVLYLDSFLYVAEVTVHGSNFNLTAKAISKDMYDAIDKVVQKLSNQIKKIKDIKKEYRKKNSSKRTLI